MVRVHRVNKVISPGTIDGGIWRFPLAEYHEERRLRICGDPAGSTIPPSVAQVTGTGVPALASEQVPEESGPATRKGEEPLTYPVDDVMGQAGVHTSRYGSQGVQRFEKTT